MLDACASINTLNTSLLTCTDELAPDEIALASGFALAAVPDDALLALSVADVSLAVAFVLSSESSALAVVEELAPETDICFSQKQSTQIETASAGCLDHIAFGA
ncbi:hypothetical protein [Bradyrhizobium cosmicum]|uniref:Uncharacterized protein n=1 Tax=Bradyrhizobium cosmicum TaxID=1404864 RepID=A0AAI8MGZ7_9BRAD|nr:hypothetical protein [Bradyrhizobium cosmicum]BAL78406.1 hypothetical protein S23_52120 [Bradyrhizobium cosmicum]